MTDISAKDRLKTMLDDLGGQRRKAAEYILARPGEVAVFSLRKVAARARVSPGTLVTLAKSLGYPSYNAFRAWFQQEEVGILDYFTSGARALQSDGDAGDGSLKLIERVIGSDLKNIAVLADEAQMRIISEAAEAVQNGRNLYVIGRRGSFGVMHYFYYTAQLVREGVHFIDGAYDMSGDQIACVGEGDVVICCGFYPYVRSVVNLVDEAARRGARIVSITDAESSPLAAPNGILITLPVMSPWIFGSITAAIVVVQALAAQMTALGGETVLDRVKQRERLLAHLDVFSL